MPDSSRRKHASSAVSMLVGMSTRFATDSSVDHMLDYSGPSVSNVLTPSASRTADRQSLDGKHVHNKPIPFTDDLRDRIITKAGDLRAQGSAKTDLGEKFVYGSIVSIATVLFATLLAGFTWQYTRYWYPAANAWSTALVIWLLLWIPSQLYLFQWLFAEVELTFHSRVWDLTSSFIQRPKTELRDVEAAHWLNDVLDSIWPFLNPDIFRPLTNIMEAIIQENAPPGVTAVSIEELGQGAQPIRLIGIRRLPKEKLEEDDDDPTAGEVFDEIMTLKPQLKSRASAFSTTSTHTQRGSTRDLRERLHLLRERTSVHLEVAFDYGQAWHVPRSPSESRVHLLLHISLVGGVRFPVWVILRKIVGTLRARVQLKPDPPFVTIATASLMGLPEIQFACRPLFRNGVNVMSMPIISNLVKNALETALAKYINPRSLTFDLGAILVGAAIAEDVRALGVIIVRIHRFENLLVDHSEHHLSTFINVSWAKTGDPLFISRTVEDSTHPRWEEQMYYEVGPEELNVQESLRLDLCRPRHLDSHECLGSLKVSLTDIVSTLECIGKMQYRSDAMTSGGDVNGAERVIGQMHWSIGFYPKVSVSEEQLQKQTIYAPMMTINDFEQQIEKHVAWKMREAPPTAKDTFDRERAATRREAELKIMNSQAPLARLSGGILNVQLPSISFLSSSRSSRTKAESENVVYDDEIEDVPSSYACIYINGHRVTKTRIKPDDSNPAFGSNVSRFIRDWQTTEVIIVVRDRRVSRSDTFLGAVRINLGKLLRDRNASYIKLAVPLEGGEGSGLVNLVLLFRAVRWDPSPAQRSWSLGTVRIDSPLVDRDDTLHDFRHGSIILRPALSHTKQKFHTNHSANPLSKTPDRLSWHSKDDDRNKLSIPVKDKHAGRLIIEFEPNPAKKAFSSEKVSAYAFLAFEDMAEHEKTTVNLPVYKCSLKELDDNDLWADTHREKRPIGHLTFSAIFLRGVTELHRQVIRDRDVDDILDVQKHLGVNPDLTME